MLQAYASPGAFRPESAGHRFPPLPGVSPRHPAALPDGIAAGMLAGVLLPFCLKGAAAAQSLPALVLPMIAVFLIVRLWNPAMATLAAFARREWPFGDAR